MRTVSVVTIGLNALEGLRSTIGSVLGQSSRADEYILVDGGSTDGSVDLLRDVHRENPSVTVVSEPDRGIADAMNKGLRLASGEWVCHLHAGDAFHDPLVLEEVRRTLAETSAGFVYAACRYVDEQGRPIRDWDPPKYDARRLGIRNFIPHPTVFFRRDLMEQLGGFDSGVRIAMDYDLWLRASKAGIHGEKIQRIVADVLDGGLSADRWKMLMDDRRVRLRNLPKGPFGRSLDYGITVARYLKNRSKETRSHAS